MKRLLILVLLLASGPAFAQSAPPKGATAVLLHSPDSPAEAYLKVARLLLADGYTLDRNDKELGFLNTKPRATAQNQAIQVAIQVSILPDAGGSLITERGTAQAPYLGTIPVVRKGMNGSPIAVAWGELMRVAGLYAGATVAYQ